MCAPGRGGSASLEFSPCSGLGLLVACPSRAWADAEAGPARPAEGCPLGQAAGVTGSKADSKPPTLPDNQGLETEGGRPGLGIRSWFRKEHGSQWGDPVLTFAQPGKAARPWADRPLSHTSAQSHPKSRRGRTWLLGSQGSATRINETRVPTHVPSLRGHPPGTFAISLPPAGPSVER